MSAPPDLAPSAASLLEAEPRLAHALGRREAAAIGQRPILPVLRVAPGPWNPPAAAQLGPGTIALAVLDGLLTGDGSPVHGPGDMLAPWGSAWVAATPVRLAVIGSAYLEPLQSWPAVLERIRTRAVVPNASLGLPAGTLEERLAALLWRVALRWGEVQGAGLTLPPILDLRALSLLLGAEETRPRSRSRRCATTASGRPAAARCGSHRVHAAPGGCTGAGMRCVRAWPSRSHSHERPAPTVSSCATTSTSCSGAATISAAHARPGSVGLGDRTADADQLVEAGHVERPPCRTVGTDHDEPPVERAMTGHERAQPGRKIHEVDVGEIDPDLVDA